MSERVPCLVPFCRRTRAAEGTPEWVCGRHWPVVPRRLRALYAAAKRKWGRDPSPRNAARCARIWKKCREAAITGGFNG